jgi:nicotinamide riboside kinase
MHDPRSVEKNVSVIVIYLSERNQKQCFDKIFRDTTAISFYIMQGEGYTERVRTKITLVQQLVG